MLWGSNLIHALLMWREMPCATSSLVWSLVFTGISLLTFTLLTPVSGQRHCSNQNLALLSLEKEGQMEHAGYSYGFLDLCVSATITTAGPSSPLRGF